MLCSYSLCAMEDPAQALREAARVLAPDGRLLIYDVALSDIPEVVLLQRLYRPIARELGAIYIEFCPPRKITYDSCLDLGEVTSRAGLRAVETEWLDPFHTVHLGVYRKE